MHVGHKMSHMWIHDEHLYGYKYGYVEQNLDIYFCYLSMATTRMRGSSFFPQGWHLLVGICLLRHLWAAVPLKNWTSLPGTRAIWHQAAPSSGNCKPPIHLPLIFRSWWTRVRTRASANPCSSRNLTLFHSIWSQSGLSDWRRLAERFLEACPLVPHQRLGAAIKLGFKPQRG